VSHLRPIELSNCVKNYVTLLMRAAHGMANFDINKPKISTVVKAFES